MNVVMLCAYNEEAIIRPTLLAVHEALHGSATPFRVVLIDDGSSDATVAEAEAAAASTNGELNLKIISHEKNGGLGAAMMTGFATCLSEVSDEDVIITLDADNTHPPRLIPQLLARLDEGYELVIASRYQKGARIDGVPTSRLWLSHVARFLMQGMFPIRGIRDYTCSFRAYRPALLRRAQAAFGSQLTDARGFEAVMDILLRLRAVDVHGSEIPIELEYETRVGNSKMKVAATIRKTLGLLARRFVQRFGADSKRHVAERIAAAGAGAQQ